jgi:hypothetical protein
MGVERGDLGWPGTHAKVSYHVLPSPLVTLVLTTGIQKRACSYFTESIQSTWFDGEVDEIGRSVRKTVR